MTSVHEFSFHNIDFKMLSPQFLLILVLSFIFGYLGIFFTIFLPLMLLFSPFLWYFMFSWLPLIVIKLGKSKLGSLLNLLPFVHFKGTWLINYNAKSRNFNNWDDMKIFLKDYFTQFAVINTGVIFFFYKIEEIAGIGAGVLNPSTNWLWYWVLLNILGLLFIIVKTIEDTEIKILDAKEDREVMGLVDLAYSIKVLFVLYLGITAITQIKADRGTAEFEQWLNDILIAALFAVGIPLFMSFIYYKSKFHEYTVNKIRMELLENREKYDLVFGKLQFELIQCNRCQTLNEYPNYFCTGCGQDISKMRSDVFDQPVTIGTLIYKDSFEEVDKLDYNIIKPNQKKLWTRNRKIRFILLILFPTTLILIFAILIFLGSLQ